MRLIAGVTLGVMVGLAVGAGMARAQGLSGFMNATRIASTTESFQAGYVSGAYDMLSYVVADPGPEISADEHMRYLRGRLACLDAIGDSNMQLKAWAQRKWEADRAQYANDLAASLMVADACGNE
jgi:hypothetical protein